MISEKELQEAARRYEKALLAGLPEPADCPADFSFGFERRMRKLILRADHPVRFWISRLLPVLLAAGIAAAAAAMLAKGAAEEPPPALPAAAEPAGSVPAPAEPDPAPESAAYRPTWLPEGCAWDREALYDGEGMIVYKTPSGFEAVFFYGPGGETEEREGEAVPVGGGTGTLLLGRSKGELNELFWSEGAVSFWLTAPFGGEDMVRVAESVEKETADP